MPHCFSCNKYLPPEPTWPPEGYTVQNAPTLEWRIYGVEVAGHKLCLLCWDYDCLLERRTW